MKESAKSSNSIILLDSNKIEYYSSAIDDIVTLEFPSEIVRDLEVLKKSDLEMKIVWFINQNKIHPSSLIMVLTESVCFEQDLPELPFDKQEAAFQNFLEYIPFENTNHKVYKLQKGYKIVAVNKELCQSVKDSFIKMGFAITAIVPTSIMGMNIKSLDAAAGKYILEKSDYAKQYTLLTPEQPTPANMAKETKVFGVRRIIMLLIIFTFLLTALLLLLYKQSTENSKYRKSANFIYLTTL